MACIFSSTDCARLVLGIALLRPHNQQLTAHETVKDLLAEDQEVGCRRQESGA